MTSTNDEKDVKSNQTSGQKGKIFYVELYKSLDGRLSGECELRDRTLSLCEAWRRVHSLCQHSAPTTHPHLVAWLQRHTARTILQTEWQSPKSKDEHKSLEEAIDFFTEECSASTEARNGVSPPWESQLRLRGEWFKKILANPWGHPVLRVLLDPRGQRPSDDEILEWLKEERGVMFVTRLRQLAASKCDDLAMSLVTAVMDRVRATTAVLPDNEQGNEARAEGTFALVLRTEAGFTVEVWELVTDIEFVLLHKADRTAKCIELAKQTPLRDGYQLVERLQSRLENSPKEKKLWKNAKEVATLIAQVIIARCMVVPVCAGVARTALYCCARSLARLVARSRLPAAAATLAAPAATARHLHTLAAAIDAQCSTDMKPFVCELYVRAITAGMNELERLKLKTEKESEARSLEQTLCSWFTQLGSLLSGSARVQCECALTAFSVHPSPAMYERIKAAPALPKVTVPDDQHIKQETTSEFGSWATDSRTQSNLVKTSDTLNIKQTQKQANVLSTAILTEGEALGLSPELCQDLAVLLSGPRLKTLSWDMDRELLLENCRTYFERTHGGTKALTTELKYLNLDPRSYQHLPEEEDDENDAYYGIEKGYEHLVEPQEQDQFSPNALFDFDTESAHSDFEIGPMPGRRKKKTKKPVSSDDELDPLCLVAEAKKTEKKKERPHSKERSKEGKEKSKEGKETSKEGKERSKDKSATKEKSKERKKKSKSSDDPSDKKEKSRERRKDVSENKEKKEKKPRNKKPKDPTVQVECKPGALSNLIGMKVAKIKIPESQYKRTLETKVPATCVTDSDYDSQGKSSLASLNSDGNGPDVLFNGLFTDEYRSPEKNSLPNSRRGSLNSEISFANGQLAINTNHKLNKPDSDRLSSSSGSSYQSSPQHHATVRDEVKSRLSGLLEFRRQKNLLDKAQKLATLRKNLTPPPQQTPTTLIKSPNAIIQPVFPEQQIISPKSVDIPEIPKVYINKKQLDQIKVIRDEVDVFLKSKFSAKPVIQFASKLPDNKPQTSTQSECLNLSTHKQDSPLTETTQQQASFIGTIPNSNDEKAFQDAYQKSLQHFLRELHESTNAGTGHGAKKIVQQTINRNVKVKKELKPMSRAPAVTPNVTSKVESKSSHCAKITYQGKRVESQLNTFARLSYLHKNKQFTEAVTNTQENMLNRSIEQQKLAKLQKSNVVISRTCTSQQNVVNTDAQNVIVRKAEKPTVTQEHPVLSNMLHQKLHHETFMKNVSLQPEKQKSMPSSMHPIQSLLSEKDQNDLLSLLRQQSTLNNQVTQFTEPTKVNKIVNNPQCSFTPNSSQFNNLSAFVSSTVIKNHPIDSRTNIYDAQQYGAIKIKGALDVTQKQNTMYTKITDCKTAKVSETTTSKKVDNSAVDLCTKPTDSFNKACISNTDANGKDWQEVLNALLSHKTPSRGPNALDMALNKNSRSNKTLRDQRIVRSNVINETSKGHKSSQITNQNYLTTLSQIPNAHSQVTKTTISSTVPLHCTNINSARLQQPAKVLESLPKKQAENVQSVVDKLMKRCTQTEPPKVIKETCPHNQAPSLQISKQTKKVSIKQTLPVDIASPVLSYTQQKIKSNAMPTHQNIIKNTTQVGKPKKVTNVKKPIETDLIQVKDPFISGISNSDYDLLEELMDDELRKEIGELSSDEESYRVQTNNVKNTKIPSSNRCSNAIKNTPIQHAKSQSAYSTNIPQTCRESIIQTSQINTSCLNKPKVISDIKLGNDYEADHFVATNIKKIAKDCKTTPDFVGSNSCPNVIHQSLNTNVISNRNVEEPPQLASGNHINVVNPRNVIITAMPPRTLQNVVLIGTDIVYDPFSTVQTNSVISNINQPAPYVTFENPPNIAVFQTTQFAAPVVNPIIIGNAMTVQTPPLSMIKKSETQPNQNSKDSHQQPEVIKEIIKIDNISSNIEIESKIKANNVSPNVTGEDLVKPRELELGIAEQEDEILKLVNMNVDIARDYMNATNVVSHDKKTEVKAKPNEVMSMNTTCNKNGERQVLKEVQEKQKLDEKIVPTKHKQRNTVDNIKSDKELENVTEIKQNHTVDDKKNKREVENVTEIKQNNTVDDKKSVREVENFTEIKQNNTVDDKKSDREVENVTEIKQDNTIDDTKSDRKVENVAEIKQNNTVDDKQSNREVENATEIKQNNTVDDTKSYKKLENIIEIKQNNIVDDRKSDRKMVNVIEMKQNNTVDDTISYKELENVTEMKQNNTVDDKKSDKELEIVTEMKQNYTVDDNKSDKKLEIVTEIKQNNTVDDKKSDKEVVNITEMKAVNKPKHSLENNYMKQSNKDKERLKTKRLALKNRVISNRLTNPPIPLTYTPLKQTPSITVEKMITIAIPKGTKTKTKMTRTKKTNSDDKQSFDNSKENNSDSSPRRILLRSSNACNFQGSEAANAVIMKTKGELKVNKRRPSAVKDKYQVVDKGKKSDTDYSNSLESPKKLSKLILKLPSAKAAKTKSTKTPKKVAKIILKIPKARIHTKPQVAKQAKTGTKKQKGKSKINKTSNKSNYTSKVQEIDTNLNFIDFEEALVGSKISKDPMLLQPSINERKEDTSDHEHTEVDAKVKGTFNLNLLSNSVKGKEKKEINKIIKSKGNPEVEKNIDSSKPLEQKLNTFTEFSDTFVNPRASKTSTKEMNIKTISEKTIDETIPLKSNNNSIKIKHVAPKDKIVEVEKHLPSVPLKEENTFKSTKLRSDKPDIEMKHDITQFKKAKIEKPHLSIPQQKEKAQSFFETSVIKSVNSDLNVNKNKDQNQNKLSSSTIELNKMESGNIVCPETKRLTNNIKGRNVNVPNNSNNIQTVKTMYNMNENCSMEYLKNNVTIDEITCGDPGKRCVRIKLPNGRTFNATITGKMHVSFETLFSNPSLKHTLLSNMSSCRRYTLNIKQVSTQDVKDPSKIIGARIEEIRLQPKSDIIETVDLLSDDEVENNFENIEFLGYKISSSSKQLFEEHRKKLTQKCYLELVRTEMKSEEIVSNSETTPIIEPSRANENELQCEEKFVDIDSLLTDKITEMTTASQVIEIDDSSNDSLKILEDIVMSDKLIEKPVDLPITPDLKDTKPEEKIDELKNLLLKDLGVEKLETNESAHFLPNEILSDVENKTLIPISKIKECTVVLSRCDKLVKQYEVKNIINQRCVVNLVRCDDIIVARNKISNDETLLVSDELIDVGFEENETPGLTRSNSFSLLNDFMFYNPETIENDETLNESYENDRSSPVIDIFETIAAFRNCSNVDRVSHECLINEEISPLSCNSEWYQTKREFSLESKLLTSLRDVCSHNYSAPKTFEKILKTEIPTLQALTIEIFKDSSVLKRYAVCCRPKLTNCNTIEATAKGPHSLKRKFKSSQPRNSEIKILRTLCEDNSFLNQNDTIVKLPVGEHIKPITPDYPASPKGINEVARETCIINVPIDDKVAVLNNCVDPSPNESENNEHKVSQNENNLLRNISATQVIAETNQTRINNSEHRREISVENKNSFTCTPLENNDNSNNVNIVTDNEINSDEAVVKQNYDLYTKSASPKEIDEIARETVDTNIFNVPTDDKVALLDIFFDPSPKESEYIEHEVSQNENGLLQNISAIQAIPETNQTIINYTVHGIEISVENDKNFTCAPLENNYDSCTVNIATDSEIHSVEDVDKQNYDLDTKSASPKQIAREKVDTCIINLPTDDKLASLDNCVDSSPKASEYIEHDVYLKEKDLQNICPTQVMAETNQIRISDTELGIEIPVENDNNLPFTHLEKKYSSSTFNAVTDSEIHSDEAVDKLNYDLDTKTQNDFDNSLTDSNKNSQGQQETLTSDDPVFHSKAEDLEASEHSINPYLQDTDTNNEYENIGKEKPENNIQDSLSDITEDKCHKVATDEKNTEEEESTTKKDNKDLGDVNEVKCDEKIADSENDDVIRVQAEITCQSVLITQETSVELLCDINKRCDDNQQSFSKIVYYVNTAHLNAANKEQTRLESEEQRLVLVDNGRADTSISEQTRQFASAIKNDDKCDVSGPELETVTEIKSEPDINGQHALISEDAPIATLSTIPSQDLDDHSLSKDIIFIKANEDVELEINTETNKEVEIKTEFLVDKQSLLLTEKNTAKAEKDKPCDYLVNENELEEENSTVELLDHAYASPLKSKIKLELTYVDNVDQIESQIDAVDDRRVNLPVDTVTEELVDFETSIEDTYLEILEQKFENPSRKEVTLVCKDRSDLVLTGIEYEDPVVGTCYVFPIIEECDDAEALHEVVQEIEDSEVNSMKLDEKEVPEEDILEVKIPKVTYSRLKSRCSALKKLKLNILKRKIGMTDVKYVGKRYRKGKHIDSYPKIATPASSAYSKEYKLFIDYCTSLKFSFSQPFLKEVIDVESMIKDWPIKGACADYGLHSDSENSDMLFRDDDYFQSNPTDVSFVEEINKNYHEDLPSETVDETNYNMGFGEGSDRVIQNLEGVDDVSKFSAATLSDVKQPQPFLLSEQYDCKKELDHQEKNMDDQLKKLKHYITYIQLRDKVRSFFKKTYVELSTGVKTQENDIDFYSKSSKKCIMSCPFDLCLPDFIEPAPIETVVQVVQVGQLPVSASAQNPVTCDPRVTQVSDASPSQCSVENSPQDDSEVAIKTEYTELTTADLTLPLVKEYAQHNQSLPTESQNASNVQMSNENIPIETEIKSVVKIELEEISEVKEESREGFENNEFQSSEIKNDNNVDYSFESNSTANIESLETESNFQNIYNTPEEKNENELYVQKQQNGTSEKTDQIAHAMNAAGITTTTETMTSATRAHALVNILSQKLRQGAIGATQSATNTYPKTTAINAMALQQALAQILPPPLNQTNVSDNNQQSSNTQVTPQVLHIVQGKNATGQSQITLVDNSQQSVISNQNATPVLHIVQNKSGTTSASANGTATPQANSFSGLSLVDAGLQQGGNQLLHIVNTGNQKNNNATGQLLKRVNLLTNLANVQGNEQKMVQFVCKSADGKSIQLNAPHQRSMVLRLQPIETPNVTVQTSPQKSSENLEGSTNSNTNACAGKDSNSQQEIKSRSVYEENYAKFIQNSSNKSTVSEKSTSLPKFNQAFGKPVFQDGSNQKNEINSSSTHLSSVNNNNDSNECQSNDNAMNLDHMGQISSPPLLLRKSPQTSQSQAQANLVQQLKQTIAPMNIQTMHGGVIYTRQIPVNIGGGQTINLITVPSTELIDDSTSKQSGSQNEIEQSIIKIIPQNQNNSNSEMSTEENNVPISSSNDNVHNSQPQPVLTQMRIKLPMLSKAPQMVSGARVVRPSFFQIQRNVIGGANQPVYQQLVLTAAPPLGQQTIRLPQTQTSRPIKVPTENQSPAESQMSSSTLEQLREFDMVLEQVKERSTVQPGSSANTSFPKLHTPSTDTTDSGVSANSSSTESTQQVLYSIGSNQPLNVAYVNRKSTVTTPTTSSFVRSPDSSGIIDSPTSSSHVQISHTATSETTQNEPPTQPKPAKVSSKTKSRPKASSNPPNNLKLNTVPPKTSTQKPLEDEQTTQRILYILAEYKEQVENSPDKDKPAPRRRSNPPSNPGSSKRKKSSSGSRRHGARDMSPIHGEDTCRTMGSEDSSCGTSQGDCNESCLESHSPQDSPRKVVRKLTFEHETPTPTPQPRPQPQRNVIVADGQTITVARGNAGKPTTAVLMPANYILPVSMVKGGQQIAIVTNRGPKLLTVGGGEGGATNALLLQRLIGPAGLKPVLARPGVRHVRLPTAALHNLQAFNLATTTIVQPPDSTASPAHAPTPPELVDTRANSSPWTDRDMQDVKPERASSPEGSEPWNLPSSGDPHDYSYEETVRADNLDRTVLDPIPDRYSPDMEAQRIFDKMFDVESKKSYMGDSHDDSPRCAYDIDASDCDDKAYHQVVQKKDGSSHRQHRLTHVSAAALRHKYAILEHELRLQKSLSEECEDLGVDSPSASELFPEAELLFAASPAHDHTQDQSHHSHTPQPTLLNQSGIPQPDIDDQIATDQLLSRNDMSDNQQDLNLGLEDVGIVTVSEDGMQATIALDQEEFARSHPNTTFHSEPTDDGEVQPFTIAGLKGRHITSTIFHSTRAPATVLMTTPQTTVISQATSDANNVKYDIDNMIKSLPSSNNANINLASVLVKDDGLTRFDNILSDSRELHLSNTASAIVHSVGNAAQVIRRVCYDEDKRDNRFLMDEPDALIAGDDAKMIAEDSSRDATMESMPGDVDDDRSSPERHAELFWESNSASASESRRPLDFSSDSEKCCKSPSYDETNSTDSSGVGTHMRLDSVIKEARGIERSGSADGSSADDTHPPLRTYPPKRMYHPLDGDMERSLSGKTRAGERSPDSLEVRRRASGRGVVKRGCHCCNGSPAPPRPKKPRQRKPTMDFNAN